MDKKEQNLDEVLEDENLDEVVEDTEDQNDDEFEYDEEGNIIIPDVIDEDVEEENDDVDPDTQDEKSDSEENEGSDESDEVVEPEDTKSDEKDKRIAELEKELGLYKSQGKDTLSKLGVETDNVLEGLEKLAAEADDIPLEEYKKKKAETQANEEAKKLVQKIAFEEKMKADFAEVQAFYPETKGLKSITEIDNFVEFGRLRDLGLSPKQAYAAANADNVKKSVANAVKQKSLNDTKQHLQSAVPKGSKDNSLVMPKSTLAEWRDLFPNKSDKEIIALYKQTINK